MTTITASEVRKLIERLTDHNHLPAVARACLALRAFADRLEADEKAVPVAWLEIPPGEQGDPYYPGYRFHGLTSLPFGRYDLFIRPVPASSDAERLAEALRDARDCAQEYFYKEKAEMTGYLHHSALPTIGESLRNIDEALAAHASQAQPPAASVTDAMAVFEVVSGVEGPCLTISRKADGKPRHEYRLAGPKPWGGGNTTHSFKVHTRELREQIDAIEAALVAQENPNG